MGHSRGFEGVGRQRPAAFAMAAASLAALSLAACDPPHPKARAPLLTIARLDCPDSQGDLTRKSAADDGKSCVYATDAGDQVTLRLISLDGKDAQTVLEPIETQLKAELPAAANPPTPPEAPDAPDGDGGKDKGDGKDKVDIDLPGLHIHTSGDGHARIDTPGVHVDAPDRDHGGHGDRAVVQVGGGGMGGVTVNANDGGAQIRVAEKGAGVRADYILASDTPGPHGYRSAGYDARGPAGGPIAVAIILARSDEHDDLRHDVRDLLKHNVGS